MQHRFFISFLFALMLQSQSASADEVALTPAEKLTFKTENQLETVYDSEGNLFSGAVILTDDEDRDITYFYRKGHKDGVAVARFTNNKPELEITYRRGRKNGEEILFYANGNPQYKKTFKDDVLDGEEILFYDNGKPQQQNFYSAGKLNGEMHSFNRNGDLIKIETYEDGIKNGIERIIADNILQRENNYLNGELDGIIKLYGPKYLTDEISYKNGHKNGLHKTYAEDGAWQEAMFKDDLQSGFTLSYYPNKILQERTFYDQDKKNGLHEEYYPNGSLKIAEVYRDGLKDGISRNFTDDGDLLTVTQYRKGIEVARTDISKEDILQELFIAAKRSKLHRYISKKNLWYKILWLGLNTDNTEVLEKLEKMMAMYAATLMQIDVYEQAIPAQFAAENKKLYFGLTPLSYVINLNAKPEILSKFIDEIDEPNLSGSTALQEAVFVNNAEIVQYLLLNGANTTTMLNGGETILTYAIKSKVQNDIISELIEAGADVNLQNERRETPLYLAIEMKNLSLINLLCTYKADLTSLNPSGQKMIFAAYANELPADIIMALAKAMENPDIQDNNGNSLLLLALKNNDINLVRYLIKRGADVNVRNNQGENALVYTLKNADDEVLALILAQNPDLENNLPEFDQPLWKVLLTQKRYALLKLIWNLMPDITKTTDINGEIPLYATIEGGDKEAIELALSYVENADDKLMWYALKNNDAYLLEQAISKAGNINSEDENGDTMLIYALKNNLDKNIWQQFMLPQLVIEAKDKEGHTALDIAVMRNNIDAARELVAKHADLNHKIGENNYLGVLKYNQPEITEILLSGGIDTSFVTKEGYTAAMLAAQNLNAGLLTALQNAGADFSVRDASGADAWLNLAGATEVYPEVSDNEFVTAFKSAAEILLSLQNDVNQQDGDGATLLVRLAKSRHPAYPLLQEYLIGKGLNPDIKDQYGKTAADYAN